MNDSDIQLIAASLKKLQPGFLPYPIFEQIARLVALPIVELVPLRRQGDSIQVLLLQRAADGPIWPGAWHTPGSVVRATDLDPEHLNTTRALERITNDELAGTALGTPQFIGSRLHSSKRGVEQAEIYWAEVLGEPKVGKFYDVTDLPATLISSQLDFISEAVEHFEQ